jgi:putative MFS transporter
VGGFLASATVATLLGLIGWHGIAALGVVPVLIGVGTLLVVTESVRWLTAKGRSEEARAAVATLLRLPLSEVPLPAAAPAAPPRASLAELYDRPALFWMTLLVGRRGHGCLRHVAVGTDHHRPADAHLGQASGAFLRHVSAAGILGKILFSFAAPLFGRRRLGQIHGFGTFLALAAAYFHSVLLGGISIFVVALAVTDFFNAGGFSNLAPYTPEAYGVRIGARASGLGQGANGAGKIIGPLSRSPPSVRMPFSANYFFVCVIQLTLVPGPDRRHSPQSSLIS